MAKLVGRLLHKAALLVYIQTSLKNTKRTIKTKEWPTHSSPTKIYKKRKEIDQVSDRILGLHCFSQEAFIKTLTATCKLIWAEHLPAFSLSLGLSPRLELCRLA